MRYDFRFDWAPGTARTVSAGVFERRGVLSLYFKGESIPNQRFEVDTWLSDGQSPEIRIDDLDFDGHEDFAVHDANSASYGFPGYSVYLYRPVRRQFERSTAFSELSEASLRFPQTNRELRRLRTFSKSGCCVHWVTEYEIASGTLRRVRTETEEELADESCLLTVEERAPDGRWTRASRACPRDQAASP